MQYKVWRREMLEGNSGDKTRLNRDKFGGRQKGDYGMTRTQPSDLAAI